MSTSAEMAVNKVVTKTKQNLPRTDEKKTILKGGASICNGNNHPIPHALCQDSERTESGFFFFSR